MDLLCIGKYLNILCISIHTCYMKMVHTRGQLISKSYF